MIKLVYAFGSFHEMFKLSSIYLNKDVVGIIVKDFGLEKNYKDVPMREIALTNPSKAKVTITLWDVNAEKFSVENFSSVVVRKAIVTEYEGIKKLNCIAGTLVWVIFFDTFNFKYRTDCIL